MGEGGGKRERERGFVNYVVLKQGKLKTKQVRSSIHTSFIIKKYAKDVRGIENYLVLVIIIIIIIVVVVANGDVCVLTNEKENFFLRRGGSGGRNF